ncbi:MAG: hypothetical protein OES09_00035 [Gammaproteobacteria bacterium]|nr:hypothetical protein [Gammaproteobacteria bacterium]
MAQRLVYLKLNCRHVGTGAAVFGFANWPVTVGSDDYQPGLDPSINVVRTLPRNREQHDSLQLVEAEFQRNHTGKVFSQAGTEFDFDDLIDPHTLSFKGFAAEVWVGDYNGTAAPTNTKQKMGGRIIDFQSAGLTRVRVTIEPGVVDLDVPFEETTYSSPANTDLTGTVVQRTFGQIFNCPAVRTTIASDTTPTWQFNGGNGVTDSVISGAWRIDGMDSSAYPTRPTPGGTHTISENASAGEFTLTSATMVRESYEGVEISAFHSGDDVGGASNPTLRETIIKYILETEGPLTSSDWSESSMTTACTNNVVGFVVNDYMTIVEILETLLEPQVVFFPDLAGVWQFFRYPADVSGETSVYDIGTANLVREPSVRTDDLEPAATILYEQQRQWAGGRELTGRGRKRIKKVTKRYEKRLRRYDKNTKKKYRKWKLRQNIISKNPNEPIGQNPDPFVPPEPPSEPDWQKIIDKHSIDLPLTTWDVSTDATILTNYPDAIEEQWETYVTDTADAGAEGDNTLAWRKVPRQIFTIPVSQRTFSEGYLDLDIGDIFTLTFPRFGCDAGKKMVCISIDENVGADLAVVEGWV